MRLARPQLLLITGILIVSLSFSVMAGEVQESNLPTLGFSRPVSVKPSVIVHFHLSGEITEAAPDDSVLLSGAQTASFRSLVNLMAKAGKDDNVKGVILTFDSLSLELGQIEELRKSIIQLKEAGKKVYVHSEDMDNFNYTLFCSADHIAMAPQSTLWLTGIYSEGVYIKDLLDKIGVKADYMQMGDFEIRRRDANSNRTKQSR